MKSLHTSYLYKLLISISFIEFVRSSLVGFERSKILPKEINSDEPYINVRKIVNMVKINVIGAFSNNNNKIY